LLSVCIVNWNTKTYLRECLASLAAHPPDGEAMEVIVVDNASSDGSAGMAAEEFPDVDLLVARENIGYADANNLAMRRAVGDILLLLNPDVRVLPNALTNAVQFARDHHRAGAVSVRFRNPDGSLQPSLRGFPAPESLLLEVMGLWRVAPGSTRLGAYFMRWFGYDRVIEVDQPMGTFLMIPRAAYESVGELDSGFPIFFNEVDWCFRAKALGWKIYFTPNAEIVHYGGQGTKQAPKASMVRESHRSLIRFYEKHYRSQMSPIAFRAAIAAMRLAEKLRVFRAREG
jgi:GT2 family glycosyltransferase